MGDDRPRTARSKDGVTYFYSRQKGWLTNGATGLQGVDYEDLPQDLKDRFPQASYPTHPPAR